MKMTIEGVDGWFDFVDQGVRQVETDVKGAIFKRSLNTHKQAKRDAPVDTGELQASVDSQILDNGMGAEIWAQAINPRNGYDYAIAQEYGNSVTMAQPFLNPAFVKEVNLLEKDMKKIGRGFGK